MATIRAGLEYLRIDPDLALKQGIKRQVVAAPTARNWREMLAGTQSEPDWFDDDLASVSSFYRERWGVPRAQRRKEFQAFRPESLRLRSSAHEEMKLPNGRWVKNRSATIAQITRPRGGNQEMPSCARADADQREGILRAARAVEAEPTLLGLSTHVAAIGRR